MIRFGQVISLLIAIFLVVIDRAEAARFQGYPEPGIAPNDAPMETQHHPLVVPELRGPSGGPDELLASEAQIEKEELEPWGGTLFGEWFHVLGPKQSVTGEYIYTGEVFNNAHGGIKTSGATAYRGNIDIVFSIDMNEAVGIEGGTFFIYGENNHGRSITTDYVGDYQTLSNLDADPFTQISEYWWMQEFGEGDVWFKIGKQDANADFCALDLAGDFVGSSFGVIPNVPMPTFPTPGMGIAGFARWSDSLLLKGGIYDGNPRGGTWGLNELGKYGHFAIFEAAWEPRFGAEGQLTGVYRFGAWRHSGEVEHVDGSGETRQGNHGFYMAFDQLVFREGNDPETDQGLGLFFQLGWAPEQYNEINRYYGCGLNYKGFFEGRDEDYIGLGWAYTQWGPTIHEISGHTYESVVELYYLCQLTDSIVLQPDFQFIANPGGVDARDCLAIGLRFEIAL